MPRISVRPSNCRRSLSWRASRIGAGALATATVLASSPAAAASDLSNCPIVGTRYTIDSPLIDILQNPRAQAAVDAAAPHFLAAMPAAFKGSTIPSITVVAGVRTFAPIFALSDDTLAAMQRGLAAVRITASDEARRCARYASEPPPRLPRKLAHPAILVFDRITGYRDAPSVDAAAAALRAMAGRQGWHLTFTDNAATFNARDLARFDAVVWNNVSGDVLDLEQRAAFKSYIERGGGFAGFHGSGGDPIALWDWYADRLVGARFLGHPLKPQFQQARVVVEDPKNSLTAGFGNSWSMTDEWYSFKTSPRTPGTHVLLTLDERSYHPGENGRDLRMGDHPIAWTRCVGSGRSFYSAIGHLPESYTQPLAMLLLERGIAWAASLGGNGCKRPQERRVR